jgi:hypothetical protein
MVLEKEFNAEAQRRRDAKEEKTQHWQSTLIRLREKFEKLAHSVCFLPLRLCVFAPLR